MIISLKKWMEFLLLLIIFSLLTFIFYHLIRWGLEQITPHFQFQRPDGSSIEVISPVVYQRNEEDLHTILFNFWGNGE
ncbi:hypothetical protein CULT_290021 [[Clostridium] ultunense Esp]|uniref:DUF4227 family protein n=1 Tax=Thermicanus aegyptius TaxID=94009 RepID=UPI0002B6F908|nr:DUF4227 family protein [Thermicanus aegyptius]CCQ95615.1 hypothetical protein CULT_290021 [[Clostridium] ultunense Esp]